MAERLVERLAPGELIALCIAEPQSSCSGVLSPHGGAEVTRHSKLPIPPGHRPQTTGTRGRRPIGVRQRENFLIPRAGWLSYRPGLVSVMTTRLSASSIRSWSDEVAPHRRSHSAGPLTSLHANLVLQLRSMVTDHRPGAAFVAAYSGVGEVPPDEILVIPGRADAALFSVGFPSADRMSMVVRIGDHGSWASPADERVPASLAATARVLFSLALVGRYREQTWTNTLTNRYVGGESFFLDRGHQWRKLGSAWQPPPLLRPMLSHQDRRYQSY